MKPGFKQNIADQCLRVIENKTAALKAELNSLSESATNESKSTAGDKHETGRAMMQLEIEKLGNQLKEVEMQRALFDKIDLTKLSPIISRGNLVETDKGYFFLAIALGKIKSDDTIVFVISPDSPLGKKLMGLKPSDTAEVNGVTYTVKNIT
jgi:hypothetical protein